MSSGGDLRRFDLLASAIAGCPLEIAAAPPRSRGWTDGATVYVDPEMSRRDQLCAAVVQAVLISAGSLDAAIIEALRRQPVLVERYLALEGHRALATHWDLVPPLVRSLIDRGLAERVDSPAGSLAIAESAEPLPAPLPQFGAIRPREMRVVPSTDSCEDRHRPRVESTRALRDLDEATSAADSTDATHDLSSPIGGRGAIGKLLQRLLSPTRTGRTAPPGAESPTHRTRSGASGRMKVMTSTRLKSLAEGAAARPAAFSYPEWDVHRRGYRAGWCTVREVAPESSSASPLRTPDSRALRLPLAKVVLELDRRHRQLQGDDIDLDALVAAQVERLTDGVPAEAVYIDTAHRRRDLAVLVLLDVSGSASEPSPSGVPIHDHQRTTAAALTFALNDLGDRVALYAFRSMGRDEVQVMPLKRFDERTGVAVLEQLAGLVPGAYTRLGAAIRHGTRELVERGGTRRRLLVVLTDGFAYDHGYEGGYGEADAARALFEARRQGVGCLCLSVGADTDAAALARVFGTAAYAVVDRPEELAAISRRLFHAALRSAEEQRRSA